MMEQGALVVFAIFLAGVIFHSGRLTARVDALEASRLETRGDLQEIRKFVEDVTGAIRHGIVFDQRDKRAGD